MTGKQITYSYDFIGVSVGDQQTVIEHMRCVRSFLATCADVPADVMAAVDDTTAVMKGD